MNKGIYNILSCYSVRLQEFGFYKGNEIIFLLELNGMFIFQVHHSKIAIRKSDLEKMNLLFLGNI